MKNLGCSTENCLKEAKCRCSCQELTCGAHVIPHIKRKHEVSYLFSHLTTEDISTLDLSLDYLKESYMFKFTTLVSEQNFRTNKLYIQIQDIVAEYSEKIRFLKMLNKEIFNNLVYCKNTEKLLIGSSDAFINSLVEMKNEERLDIEGM